MAEQFLGFGQLTRPDIGLLASQNLAEIYKTDQPDALRNIGLRPEILDIIYEVSETITREDLRAVSDLSTLLITTLHLQKETFQRINEQLFDDEVYASTLNRIGVDRSNETISGNATRVEHTIIYNGAIQCSGAAYRERGLGATLFEGKNIDTFFSTSRSSLLNAVKYSDTEDNTGFFKEAIFPGSIRVRRRSHVNAIDVNPLTFIPAPAVVEQPSKLLKINIKNGSGTTSAVKFLATKNSPLKLPCRLSKGKITLTFHEPGQFFYGVQIQPQNGKEGETPGFLSVDPQPQQPINNSGQFGDSHVVNIDITGTGYENNFDLYMYLYLNPEIVKGITFEGLEITDFFDGKDIGLIGFTELESLKFESGSRSARIKTLPIGLKILDDKLKTLDISRTADVWRENSQMGYFDYRLTAQPANLLDLPFYTMTSYLTVPQKGIILNELGDGYNGGPNGKLAKYSNSAVGAGQPIPVSGDADYRTPGTDFRVFTAMRTLILGDRVKGNNVRLDDVYPNLRTLSWEGTRYVDCLSGSPPKIANPADGNGIDSYSIARNQIPSSFSIYDIGTSPTVSDANLGAGQLCHLSKYKIRSFNVRGDHYRRQTITGDIGGRRDGGAGTVLDASEWTTWFENTQTINISESNNNLRINLQPEGNFWQRLSSLGSYRKVGCSFKAAVGGINADGFSCPLISQLDLREWNEMTTDGVLPRLGLVSANECDPIRFYISNIKNLTPFVENGFNYIFAANFASGSGATNGFRLEKLLANDLKSNGYGKLRIRRGMFDECRNLKEINFHSCPFNGTFPNIPNKELPNEVGNDKSISLNFHDSDFHDLRPLSISGGGVTARDLSVLTFHDQNTEGKGCIIPSFEGRSQAKISSVIGYNSLPTTYPSGWIGTAGQDIGAGKIVSAQHTGNSVSGLTPGSVSNTDDEIYYIDGTDLDRKVLVNDGVSLSSGGAEIARVISVEPTRIYLDSPVTGNTFFFKRNTVDISNWFQQGSFNNLTTFRMSNCRLSGQLKITKNLPIKTGSDGTSAFDLSNNNISDVATGSFSRIFQGGVRSISIDLSKNDFSPDQIRNMLEELLDIDKEEKYVSVKVFIKQCKKIKGIYEQHSAAEIFPTTTIALPDQEINLTRTETIKVYEIVIPIDEEGNELEPIKTQIGTKNIVVPGQEFTTNLGSSTPNGVGYYKTKTSGRTQERENSTGERFRRAKFFKIDLGVIYQAPSTSPEETSVVYGDYAGSGMSARLDTIREVVGDDFEQDDLVL